MQLFAIETHRFVAVNTVGEGVLLLADLTWPCGDELFCPNVQQLLIREISRKDGHTADRHIVLFAALGTNKRVTACAQIGRAHV